MEGFALDLGVKVYFHLRPGESEETEATAIDNQIIEHFYQRRKLSMAYEVITLRFDAVNGCFHAEEVNRFCLNKRIRFQRVEFIADGASSYWTVFLEYDMVLEPPGQKTDHLSDAGKLCYERLRVWRKESAGSEGNPPYVITNNRPFLSVN